MSAQYKIQNFIQHRKKNKNVSKQQQEEITTKQQQQQQQNKYLHPIKSEKKQ